jgi:hypothetical protein
MDMHSLVDPFITWLSRTEFSKLMTASKWWWAFLMDLHFIGLALLVGAVGILDLRILGFAKQFPVAPLNKLIPWAVLGFSINLVTGVLAYIGMPVTYTYNVAFLLKMCFIALAGINVLLFYCTPAFRGCEAVGPSEDAPVLAKLIAGTSLFLWFAVIILGRYIQEFN